MADQPRYHALRMIAQGGTAEVFLGEQLGAAGFKRLVVLKRIHPALYANDEFREMLIEEAHLAMGLHHSNLVEILDLGESNGRYFLVMELVDGWTLGQLAKRGHTAGMPLPPELAVYLAAEACRGLSYAHQRTKGGVRLGIVHRDICPNNILVSFNAEVKVADFGIAKASTRTSRTGARMVRGKPNYMSPEQAQGDPLDERTDLFSMGTVLFQLLTGKLPFLGATDMETLAQVVNAEAPSPATLRPELPAELCKVVLKAMAKKREDRFASAQEMLQALERVQRTELPAAGRSELERYLWQLSAQDGSTPIAKQTLPPAPAKAEDREWISLSAERAVVPDQTATERAVPSFASPPRSSRWRWLPWAVVALALAAAGWRWLQARPAPLPSSQPALAQAPAPPPTAPPLALEADAATPEALDASTQVTGADEPLVSVGIALALPESDAGAEDEEAPAEPTSEDAGAAAFSGSDTRPSRTGTPSLRLSARLAPEQTAPAGMVAVFIDSQPSGVVIKVDKRVLGRTPATLRFKNGLIFDVWFEAPGQLPLRRWLMLTERQGKPPKVTLRAPVE